MKRLMYCSTLFLGFALLTTPLFSQDLVTIKVNTDLSETDGRSIVNARNHYLIIDSPPPLGGPNEEINPIEILLSALGSCGVLVSEKVAQELDIPLKNASATVEGKLDPRGVKGEDVNPRIQEFKIKLTLTGVSQEEANKITDAIKKRCPVYTTLERSAPIKLEVVLDTHEAEKSAIINVIEAEHLAFSQRNFKKMASYYAQSENSVAGNATSYAAKGWEEISKLFQSYIKNNPEPSEPRIGYDYNVTVSGDRAWVTFNQKKKNAEQDSTKELRVMVKENEEWKVSGMLFFEL